MTAVAAAPAAARRRAPLTPHGLTWAVLRLHRTALYVAGASLVAFAAAMVWLYVVGDDARAANRACGAPRAWVPSCEQFTELADSYGSVLSLTTTALSYLMFPVAAWAGGALIGRELESGTALLAWTQSVTPLRWLAAKLAVPALLLTAGTTAAVLLNVWARQDENPDLARDWYYPDVFVSTGPVAVTYVLAGLALGALAGLATRRALPAAGVGFVLTLFLYNILERSREDLWPTVEKTSNTFGGLPRSAFQVENGMVLVSGERVTGGHVCSRMPPGYDCVPDADIAGYYRAFHPPSHFWPLQFVDAAIALAVAALATATAFWLLRRRTG
ncbi:hypothetical protein ACFYO0_43485 [Streptomyces sp. NPDC006365]|uniref:hypothetical protein n=1 Tax=Streptomyces sp. NPDC006365 TaxID=3364744 RepID=UPI00367F493D